MRTKHNSHTSCGETENLAIARGGVPGRGMNRLVAERVMGWQFLDRVKMGWGPGPDTYSTGDETEDGSPSFQGFEPSTEINHAWRVVEHLQKKHVEVRVTGYNRDEWFCDIAHFLENPGAPNNVTGEGTSAPLAICRAALRWCSKVGQV